MPTLGDTDHLINCLNQDPEVKELWVLVLAMTYLDAETNYRATKFKKGQMLTTQERLQVATQAANDFVNLLMSQHG